jgi:hypothetical protein
VQAIIDAGGPQPWFTQAPAGHSQAWVMHPQFSFKVIDGDSPALNQAGRAWNTIEGYAGNWVVRFGSSYPPRCFYKDRYAPQDQIQEKNVIRRGFYIRIGGSVEGNANAQKPGLYVNLDMVELTGYGPEITSGPDAAATFGAAPAAYLPAGASATPLTPAPAAPGAPAAPVPPTPAVAAAPPSPAAASPAPANPPAPPAAPAPQRPTDPAHIHAAGTADEQWWNGTAWVKAPAPYAGFMAAPVPPTPPAATPPVPVAAPTAVAPSPPAIPPSAASATISPSRVMLPAANGATYEQMLASGWTDETLRAHGMMQ